MARKRTIIIVNQPAGGAMEPLGTVREFLGAVGRYNISGDGSGPTGFGTSPGMNVLYGPGMVLEVPGDGDPKADVMQAMVTVTDDDFAWPVLQRMCRELKWKMMDPDSGRTFG